MVNSYKLTTPDDLERIVADKLGLRLTNGSGSKHNNGDGIGKSPKGKVEETYDKLLAECKFSMTVKKSATIQISDMIKTKKSAMRYGRIPVMATGNPDGNVIIHIGIDEFAAIYEAARQNME